MNDQISFQGSSIVSCGTMRPELQFLQQQGWLDADKVLFTGPGMHDKPADLNRQLRNQLKKAKEASDKVIVVFGKRCYLDMNDPYQSVETIMSEIGEGIIRIQADNCVDFLVDQQQRNNISQGRKVYWLTPGWLLYWDKIFKGWDVGLANETFPQNDAAVLLDPFNVFDDISINDPEKLLAFSDFMQIPIEPVAIDLIRFKGLLAQALRRE